MLGNLSKQYIVNCCPHFLLNPSKKIGDPIPLFGYVQCTVEQFVSKIWIFIKKIFILIEKVALQSNLFEFIIKNQI